jgi:hypothetical protein
VADYKDSGRKTGGNTDIYVRHAGQFIFWALIMLVGWSFYTTLQNDKAIAVMEQRITALEIHLEKVDP